MKKYFDGNEVRNADTHNRARNALFTAEWFSIYGPYAQYLKKKQDKEKQSVGIKSNG